MGVHASLSVTLFLILLSLSSASTPPCDDMSQDVQHRKIPCALKNIKDLLVKVEEGSINPNKLVISFLHQGGQTDFLLVDVFPEGEPKGTAVEELSQNGAVWETAKAPAGPLQLQMLVNRGDDLNMVTSEKALPADWKVGEVYDLGIQTSEVAKKGMVAEM